MDDPRYIAVLGQLDQLSRQVDELSKEIDMSWLAVCGMIVCFMQAGFAALEVGSARVQNSASILLLKFAYTFVSSIGFYFLGFDIAFSARDGAANTFLGTGQYNTNEYDQAFVFFELAFANTASTIVSGALLERTRHIVFFVFIFLFNIILYPVVAHWVWSKTGFLSVQVLGPALSRPMLDFAGASVVHMTGGLSALVGCWLIGPREGFRDEKGTIQKISGHSVQLTGIGALILWFGFFAFNAGSTLALSQGNYVTASLILNNTALAGASAGLAAMIVLSVRKEMNIDDILNAALAGLVAITSGCNVVTGGPAVFIGAVAGLVYLLSAKLVLKAGLDDPVNAISVHAAGGIWGLIGTGIVANRNAKALLTGDPLQFVIQITGAVLVAAWTLTIAYAIFMTVDRIAGLRVSIDEERQGLDAKVGAGQNLELLTIKATLLEINGLEKLLEDLSDPLIAKFHAFLAQEWCSENLDFLTTVKKFRNKYVQHRRLNMEQSELAEAFLTEMATEAQEIWSTFVSYESTFQINVSSVMRKATEEDVNSKEPRRIEMAFTRCYYEVLGMISRDQWRRFIQSLRDEGALLEAVGSQYTNRSTQNADLDSVHIPTSHRPSIVLRQVDRRTSREAAQRRSRKFSASPLSSAPGPIAGSHPTAGSNNV